MGPPTSWDPHVSKKVPDCESTLACRLLVSGSPEFPALPGLLLPDAGELDRPGSYAAPVAATRPGPAGVPGLSARTAGRHRAPRAGECGERAGSAGSTSAQPADAVSHGDRRVGPGASLQRACGALCR